MKWRDDTDLFDLMTRELYSAVLTDILDELGFTHQMLSPRIRPLHPVCHSDRRGRPDLSGRRISSRTEIPRSAWRNARCGQNVVFGYLRRHCEGLRNVTLTNTKSMVTLITVIITDVRARWVGHRLHAEVNVAVPPDLSIVEGHAIAKEVYQQLLHHLPYLSVATMHVDPVEEAGEQHHRIFMHNHDGLPAHAH